MTYKPIQGQIKIGYRENYPEIERNIFCAEILDNTYFSAQSSKRFSKVLRQFNVEPFQLDNIGTENPIITNPLSERKLEELEHILSRPITVVSRLPKIKDTKIKEKIDLNEVFIVEIGADYSKFRLNEIPNLLNKMGCELEDILFREKISEEYYPLANEYISYIISLLAKHN